VPDGVLITRPEPGASATAKAVRARGLRPFCVSFLAIRPFAAELPKVAQAVLVTSGNALAAPLSDLHDTPLLAVGDATAARARAAGFTRVDSAGADARALAALVAARCDPGRGPLLLLTGKGHGGPLAEDLRARGFSVLHRAVYASLPVTTFPPQADEAIGSAALRAATFFSAETARAFAATLPAARAPDLAGIDALAIAPAAADALAGLPWRSVRVALHPTQDELLALL
jgi:uroporphyrinogen-III synthase